MWSIASQHKKYNDSLSGYNSLRDPHLHGFFSKPQVRRHLIRANIINKENKIVDEISSTRHLQIVERKHKRELYHMLEEMVKHNEQAAGEELLRHESGNDPRKAWSIKTQEDLIQQAKIMFNDANKEHFSLHKNIPSSKMNERSSILQRLDRMIRTITESEHLNTNHTEPDARARPSKSKAFKISSDSNMRTSKSWQDISDSRDLMQSEKSQLKSHSSSSHLSRMSRPKSSYGRQRPFLSTSDIDLTQDSQIEADETMVKSKSVGNIIQGAIVANGEDIESVGGDSWSESDLGEKVKVSDHENGRGAHRRSIDLVQSKPSGIAKKAHNAKYAKKSSRQQVQMTLKYNGLNGSTNRDVKRSVKVLQQVTMGGNSILIYDGFIVPGDMFTFDIRPHPTNSFSIIILMNGIRDLRLNTCCEHKHRPGTRLSHYTFVDVVGGRPCFACQNVSTESEKTSDVTKYLDWLSPPLTDQNEIDHTDSPATTSQTTQEELNENKGTDSVIDIRENNLESQQLDLESAPKTEQDTESQPAVTEQEEIHSVSGGSIEEDIEIIPNTEPVISTPEQSNSLSQLDQEGNLSESISIKEDPSKRLASIIDDLDEVDIKVIDYISEETLPIVSNLDSDSDNSVT